MAIKIKLNGKCKLVGLVCLASWCLVAALGFSTQTVSAQNVIMGIEPITALHPSLFRGGANTFQFNSSYESTNDLIAQLGGDPNGGAYNSFLFTEVEITTGGGLSHNGRVHIEPPDTWDPNTDSHNQVTGDLDADFLPIIDRAAFGHVFDPNEYEIEVKFRPVIAGHPIFELTGGAIANEARSWGISLDQLDGFVFDAQAGIHKRAGEQHGYGIGGPSDPNSGVRPINDMYLDPNTPKDAEGFMTVRIPVNQPTFSQRGFYYEFGDGTFRTDHTLAGGGRVNDPNDGWIDVTDGFDSLSFDGPLQGFGTPQGVPVIGLGSSFDPNQVDEDVYIDVKSILLKKTNPDPTLVARLDSESGITHRFGTSLNYSDTGNHLGPLINVNGTNYQPLATTEISRFDEDGMTNLMINAHAAEDPNNSGYQFVLRMPPDAHTFDGTDAVVTLRARLLEAIGAGDADSLRVILKDLDRTEGDTVAEQAAEEYFFDFDLTQLNTSTLTSLTMPLSAFTRDATADGFTVNGDNDITDFNLYELTGLILNGGGLLHLEIDFIDVRLPSECGDGDFDCDGDVDGLDFLSWQRGDSPNNGSQGDLALWETNYGAGGLQGVAAVPEPSTVLLASLAACGLSMCGRRRGR